MKKIRSILIYLLVLMMVLPMHPGQVLAEDTEWPDEILFDSGEYEGISWQIKGFMTDRGYYESKLFVSGNGPIPDFSNPSDGCPGDVLPPWFKCYWGWEGVGSDEGVYLQGIQIGSGITSIGRNAFSPYYLYASTIDEIVIPDTVTSIGSNAFYNQTHLKKVVIPDSVTSIGSAAFDRNTTIACSSTSEAYRYAQNNGYEVELTDLKISLKIDGKTKKSLTMKAGDKVTYTATTNVAGLTPTVTLTAYPTDGLTLNTSKKTITAKTSGTDGVLRVTAGGQTVTCNIHVKRLYTIQYVLDGATNDPSNPSSYLEGKTVTLKKATRKGYAFKGWYRNRWATFDSNWNLVYEYSDKVTKLKNENAILYAYLKEIKTGKVKGLALKNKKTKKLAITFDAVSGAKGYQVKYSTSSKFTKSTTKTKTITTTAVTLTKLTKNKTYYVRVRAFKKDSTGARVYGAWSTTKKIKITK